MPFGLTNALVTYQALINNVLRVYLDIFVIVYLDDILIYLENKVEYPEYVRIVLTLLREHALILDPNKYQ
jgi:hypothetical protein